MVPILLGNFVGLASLKFEVFEIISLRIRLVSSAMEHDTRELFCCLACDSLTRCYAPVNVNPVRGECGQGMVSQMSF